MDKQIEEMAKVIFERGVALESIDFIFKSDHFERIATALYNAGYRKIPENAVVIEKTEYDKLRLLADECLDWRRKCCNVAELPKENAVVLAREGYEKFKKQDLFMKDYTIVEVLENEMKKARKETAEKFGEKVNQAVNAYRKKVDEDTYVVDARRLIFEINEIVKEFTGGKNGQ